VAFRIMDIYVAISWIMFLGLFGLAFFWLRRAWIIGVKKDFSSVALKKGLPPKEPSRYAKYSFIINLVGGGIFVLVILLVVIIGLEYKQWTAISGITLWMKFLADFALSRKAHLDDKVKK